MRRVSQRLVVCLSLFAAIQLVAALPSPAQDAKKQIETEIAALEKRIQAGPDSDENWKDSKPNLTKSLASARDNLAAGRTYFCLVQLAVVGPDLAGLETTSANPDLVRGGIASFEKEWKRRDLRLVDYNKRYDSARWDRKSSAVRAIAEVMQGQTRPLFEASLPYAKATQIQAGLYYLGRSQGSVDYAFFCQRLNLSINKNATPARSLAPELEVLQARVLAAYQPPVSIAHHSEFIQINSQLKAAKELDAAHLYYGSLYKYLDAIRLLAMLDAKTPEAGDAAKLAADAATFRKTFAASSIDQSIGEIFLERAESALAAFHADKSDISNLQAARVNLETVLPAYIAAIDNPLPALKPPDHIINVTLVRWPYT